MSARTARRSAPAVVRRRRAAVLAVAAAAVVGGVSVGAGGDDEPLVQPVPTPAPTEAPRADGTPVPTPTPSPGPVDDLSLQEQVGKLVVLRFEGTTAPTYVRRVLRRGWAAGAILFKPNISSPGQLKALTRSLRRAGQAAGAMPIVCTDQEGGDIRNVAWAPPEWHLSNPHDEDYLDRVRRWIARNHLEHVCRFDIEAGMMTPFR